MNSPIFTRRGLVKIAGLSAVPLATCGHANGSSNGDGARALATNGATDCPAADTLGAIVSIADFGAKTGENVVPAMERALASFPHDKPGVLVVPPGDWPVASSVDWSRFKHVTIRIEPGAILRHGLQTVTLPANVETGTTPHTCFVGEGKVAVRDKDTVAYNHLPKGWIAYSNFAMGVRTLAANVSGTNNFAWGNNALAENIRAGGNIAIGNDTLTQVKGGTLPALGTQTGLGWNNIALGDTALRDCTDGYENLAIGAFCLQQSTSGKWNVAIGHASQILSTTGECNISLGSYALVTNFGSNNLAIGWAALEGQVTGSNIAIGHMAMNANQTGSLNTAIGSEALMRIRSGNFNVSMGIGSLTNLVSGVSNTGIGSYALSSAQGAATNNTALGRDALLLLTTGNGNTAVGTGALSTLRTFTNCTGIGAAASVTGNNQVQLGNVDTVPHAFSPLQIRSDARDKVDIRDTLLGLDFVRSLRPVDFRWNFRERYSSTSSATTESDSMKGTRFHHGLIAQEVRNVIKGAGIDFGGYQDHNINGGEDVLSLGYEEFISPLIKSIQELALRVDELQREVRRLTQI